MGSFIRESGSPFFGRFEVKCDDSANMMCFVLDIPIHTFDLMADLCMHSLLIAGGAGPGTRGHQAVPQDRQALDDARPDPAPTQHGRNGIL